MIDSYRDQTRNYNFLDYAFFVTFFPQLIAGPIVHHKDIVSQFANRWNLTKRYSNIALGLTIFSFGLFKKVVLADTFALWATPGFDTLVTLNLFQAWATSLSYTFQLYFDFSGYTDMAIGAALLFNIRLPINFNSPYKASSIQDFWRRWHITLSNFLRDYVYIPLGGNRKSELRTCFNLFFTFLLGGLWHGASWMFVIWGAMHGGALVIHRLWQRWGIKLPLVVSWFVTFNFVNLTWVFSRAKNLDSALKVLKGMAGLEDANIGQLLNLKYLEFITSLTNMHDFPIGLIDSLNADSKIFLMIIAGFGVTLLAANTVEMCAANRTSKALNITAGVLFGAVLTGMYSATPKISEFLYFSF